MVSAASVTAARRARERYKKDTEDGPAGSPGSIVGRPSKTPMLSKTLTSMFRNSLRRRMIGSTWQQKLWNKVRPRSSTSLLETPPKPSLGRPPCPQAAN